MNEDIILTDEEKREMEEIKKKMDEDPEFAKKILTQVNEEMKKFLSENA